MGYESGKGGGGASSGWMGVVRSLSHSVQCCSCSLEDAHMHSTIILPDLSRKEGQARKERVKSRDDQEKGINHLCISSFHHFTFPSLIV